MIKRIQTPEDGRAPARGSTNWRIEGQKNRITRKEYQRLVNKFEMKVFEARKGFWNFAKERMLKERGIGEKRKTEEKKDENQLERVKRRRDGLVSVEAFEIFGQGRDLESCGGLSWEDLVEKPEDLSYCEPDTHAHVRVLLDVPDVTVSPSSVVAEFCHVFSCCSDWEFVEPQSFLSLPKASTLLYKFARRDEV